MTTTRAPQVPIGSSQWVQNEREQIFQFEGQENEDFAFAARNELEWLNEHMAEIFSHDNLNVAEIFKTPGKLRGKTPRTNRKKNALEARAPLTDVFASDIRYNGSPSRPQDAEKKLRIQSPRVTKQAGHQTRNAAAQPSRPIHHDSGYQGMTEDEMEVEIVQPKQTESKQQPVDRPSDLSDERRTTEGSFHSARENVAKETPAPESKPLEVPGSFPRDTPVPMEDVELEVQSETLTKVDLKDEPTPVANKNGTQRSPSSEGSTPEKPPVRKGSLNFASLPAREPLTTKKSIGHRTSNMDSKNQPFGRSSYFGRFTGGKSLGPGRQAEGEDVDVEQSVAGERGQDQAKYNSKSSTQRLHERITLLGKASAPRPTKSIHNNATAMAIPAQAADRIHSRAESQTPAETEPSKYAQATEEEEDDWTLPPIKAPTAATRPILSKSRSVDVMEQFAGKDSIGGEQLGVQDADREVARQRSPLRVEPLQEPLHRMYGHQKSASTTIIPSPEQQQGPTHKKTISVSNPTLPSTESTTPTGSPSRPVPSPSRFHIDGHLSASKSKLQSIMRSARGLFTSTAGVSAQAKMEALSPSSSRIRVNEAMQGTLTSDQLLYPKLNFTQSVTLESSSVRQMHVQHEPKNDYQDMLDVDGQEAAKIEPSKAREEEQVLTKASHKPTLVERSLESTSKPIRQSPRKLAREEDQSETGPSMETASKSVQAVAPPSRPQSQVTHLHKPQGSRRPVKPPAKPTTKPPQVAIRVGMMSQRIPLTNNNALSAGLQDTLAPPAKQQGLNKKASNASIQTAASSASLKSSTSSNAPKPKSLVLAAQKKEQAEKEAQRKEEEKKERERKRAAAQEEAQRKEREQRQREEAERQKERERVAAEEAKRRAQKEAADKKRMEANRKPQQTQATQQQLDLKRAANELSKSVRGDAGNRPPSRMGKGEESLKAPAGSRPVDPAKTNKRVFDPDNEDELSRPAGNRPGQTYQQTNDKRRRTGEEEELRSNQRPTLQPPIRQSNIRKPQVGASHDQGFGYSTHGGSKPSIFNGNYPTAPPPAPIHASSKHPGMNQAYQHSQPHPQQGPSGQPIRMVGHPMDMAKFQSGKIPFAEAPNPPATSYKTPHQKKQAQMPNTNKSSPMYANGEHIHLKEIATDSEDEDTEDERDRKQAMPDWVRTPNLFDNLASQETINPDAVFGPIAPLNMEEMFRDKSRHHKFHKRTSSANWHGADRLTEDDIRQDMAARNKMRQDGGWSYGL